MVLRSVLNVSKLRSYLATTLFQKKYGKINFVRFRGCTTRIRVGWGNFMPSRRMGSMKCNSFEKRHMESNGMENF